MHGKPMTKTFRALMIALLALPMALQAADDLAAAADPVLQLKQAIRAHEAKGAR
jgi:hypothetical protein